MQLWPAHTCVSAWQAGLLSLVTTTQRQESPQTAGVPYLCPFLDKSPVWGLTSPTGFSCPLSICSSGRLSPRPVGKVALFLRSGQTGTQPSGAGHSTGPCVHGPGEPDPAEALPATGLRILQTGGLRLAGLSRGEPQRGHRKASQ